MHVRVVDGAPVHECGLCSARFGGRDAVAALDAGEEARHRGVDPGIWPLVRALERLPGVVVRAASAADERARALPFVAVALLGPVGLVQLENVAKSLRLGAGALLRPWGIEVEYRQQLTFVLQPRHGGGEVPAPVVRDAGIDVDVLARQLDRDARLSWWRHPAPAP
jgi:hypothetical protein